VKRATRAERVRQTARLLKAEGGAGVAARALRQAANRLSPAGYGALPVSREHLLGAAEVAANGWVLPEPAPVVPGEPLRFGWVLVPPRPGSGGHTTMFRMISALEQAGHECTVYLLDRHGWEIEQHERAIRRWWPWLKADVADFADGMRDSHGIFATAWQTAYPVLASPATGKRFYFVQDFEPAFYPAGSHAFLAEATYRFGFHGVTAGPWLAGRVWRDYGMRADHFDFGCDVDRYVIQDPSGAARTGVCYYCRPSTPRRAYELAMVALDLFATRHPEVDIHLFGMPAGRLPFRATDHGTLTPDQLNDLYNRCVAGLALSATNVSLVPHEMLAAGCIPVVNDAEQNRLVLDNEHVAYAQPTPFELADALWALVERPPAERAAAAAAAAASVQGASWEAAGARVEQIVRRMVADAAPAGEAAVSA